MIEAMKQALEALENVRIDYDFHGNPADDENKMIAPAIATLRTAIKAAEKQEPIHTTTTSLVSKEWRLVPVYPTKDMARAYWRFNDRTDVRMVDAWNAILEVAPALNPLPEKAIVDLLPESIPAQYDGALIEFARVIEATLKEKANDNATD